MTSNIPNIFLITVEALRFDFMSHERILSLISRRYQSNMHYGPCIAAGPYTWASVPSIFTALQPRLHNFNRNINEPTLIDVLRVLGYKTLTVKPSEATMSLLYPIYNKFDKIIDIRCYGRNTNLDVNTYSFYYKFVKKSRDLLRSILRYEPLVLNKFQYLFNYIENILYKISYALRLIPQHKQNLYFSDSRHIYTTALYTIQNMSEPIFMWIHILDTHEPYTYDVIQKFGIGNYIELMVRILSYQVHTYIRILKMIHTNISIKNVLESIASELVEDSEIKYIKNRLCSLYDLAIEYMCKKLSVFINYLMEQYNNILLILTSDHGEELFDHHSYGHLGILTPWGFVPVPYNELTIVPIVIVSPVSMKVIPKEGAKLTTHYAIPSLVLRILKEYLHNNKMLAHLLKLFEYRSKSTYLYTIDESGNVICCIPSESQAIVYSVPKKLGKGVSLKLTCTNTDDNSSYDILIHPFYGIKSSRVDIDEGVISTLVKEYLSSIKRIHFHVLTSKVKWRLKMYR